MARTVPWTVPATWGTGDVAMRDDSPREQDGVKVPQWRCALAMISVTECQHPQVAGVMFQPGHQHFAYHNVPFALTPPFCCASRCRLMCHSVRSNFPEASQTRHLISHILRKKHFIAMWINDCDDNSEFLNHQMSKAESVQWNYTYAANRANWMDFFYLRFEYARFRAMVRGHCVGGTGLIIVNYLTQTLEVLLWILWKKYIKVSVVE